VRGPPKPCLRNRSRRRVQGLRGSQRPPVHLSQLSQESQDRGSGSFQVQRARARTSWALTGSLSWCYTFSSKMRPRRGVAAGN
jgi:hypothetical protein